MQVTSLKLLDLSGNALQGTLPAAFGAALQSLSVLLLGSNSLTGTLPPAWSSLTSLTVADLGDNNLYGFLPSSWSAWSNMRGLRLTSNSLTGSLPATYGSWAGIQELELGATLCIHLCDHALLVVLALHCIGKWRAGILMCGQHAWHAMLPFVEMSQWEEVTTCRLMHDVSAQVFVIFNRTCGCSSDALILGMPHYNNDAMHPCPWFAVRLGMLCFCLFVTLEQQAVLHTKQFNVYGYAG